MFNNGFTIQSQKGPYELTFESDVFKALAEDATDTAHFIVDKRVAELYDTQLGPILNKASVLYLEATEENKSLDKFPAYVAHLVKAGVKRKHSLIAIGGGIIQDTTCFLAATLLRGLDWKFYPTTLLAQTDSCIGSKSSINSGGVKNILGTFTPPQKIHVARVFLDTLDERDLRSGIGEMLKVHAIDSLTSFQEIASNYDRLLSDRSLLLETIKKSLLIKKKLIEVDEFDQGIRNLLNYGHSFGHAIESATNYGVPHGIAVTMGMDLANYVAMRLGYASQYYELAHPVLQKNYKGFEGLVVPLDLFCSALSNDKKNLDAQSVALILPNNENHIEKINCKFDDNFKSICLDYFINRVNV